MIKWPIKQTCLCICLWNSFCSSDFSSLHLNFEMEVQWIRIMIVLQIVSSFKPLNHYCIISYHLCRNTNTGICQDIIQPVYLFCPEERQVGSCRLAESDGLWVIWLWNLHLFSGVSLWMMSSLKLFALKVSRRNPDTHTNIIRILNVIYIAPFRHKI